MTKSLIDFVGEVEGGLADLLDRKELGRYAPNKGFGKIKQRIIEIAGEIQTVVEILAGEGK